MKRVSNISSESSSSIVDKGWRLITPHTEILIIIIFGVASVLAEVTGFWPTLDMSGLMHNAEDKGCSNDTHVEDLYPELKNGIYKFSEVIKTAEMYTIHIYLTTYLLLPYPVITEKQRVLLTPWLLCGVLRSLLLSLLKSLAGIVFCALHSKLCYNCLQFSAWRAAELCISVYTWTSVHSFYYLLNQRSPVQEVEKVLQSINRARRRSNIAEKGSSHSSMLMSLNSDDLEEDVGEESTLVERAAMAWIAREILENGDDYVTDAQFNQFLALKATMELRQIVKEIAEKKIDERRKARKMTVKERIEESLDIYKRVEGEQNAPSMRIEAFEQSKNLSRRDPIRRIPPLTILGTGQSPSLYVPDLLRGERPRSSDPSSQEKEVEVQTDPLSPEMIQLFDMLEAQAKRRLSKRGPNYH